MKTTLVILTRNEIQGLQTLFNQLPLSQVDECLAVDYQSTDGTVQFLINQGIKVVHQKKHGRGEAFRLAIAEALGEAVVFFSPDGNENPNDIPKLLSIIQDGYDMAIASRFMKDSRNEESNKLLPLRAWANQSFTLLCNLFFKGNITDSINGFRAVNKKSFNQLAVNAEGFAIEYQMSIKALKLKQKIKEIPTLEGNRIGGQSTAHSIPTGLKILKILLKEIYKK